MRNMKTATWAALLGASLLVLTACTGDNTTGTPTPASPTPTSAALPDGVPPVPAPLNPATIQAAPCSPITPEQVASLGMPQKDTEVHPDDTGACSWGFVTGGKPASFSGSLLMNIGLQGLYSRHQMGGLTKFEPFTTAGYPGVVYDTTTNTPPGGCALTVALQNNIGYTISVSLNSDNSPLGNGCELGKKVAGFVVEYLKGKS
jgi:hypothetical protein